MEALRGFASGLRDTLGMSGGQGEISALDMALRAALAEMEDRYIAIQRIEQPEGRVPLEELESELDLT